MTNEQTSQKEPFLRIAKRSNIGIVPSILIRVVALLLACLVTLILCRSVADFSFADTTKYMFAGSFENGIKLNAFFREAALLLLFGVALAPAFRMRFWNIGAQGQVLFGGLLSAVVMHDLAPKMPNAVSLILMFVVAVLGGMIFAVIPAYFKVRYNTNETLFTLMMNYIAIQIVKIFCDKWRGVKSSLGVMNDDLYRLQGKGGWFPKIFGNDYAIIYIAAILLAVLMYIYLTRTKQGFEISVIGESMNTARYAGINDRAVILRTILISGGLCGIIGFFYVSTLNHTISATTGGTYGFTAIIVAWLAKFNPFFMMLIALLLSFLTAGSKELVNHNINLNSAVGSIIIAVFLFFILGCEFFVRYRLIFSEPVRNFFSKISCFFTSVFDRLKSAFKKGETKV